MNRLKAMSNTGEGGEDPARFSPAPNKDSLRSSVKQIAAGRFGVTTHYLVNADELQIKISQGAKPGEGGHLPGHKVNRIIAKTRYTTPGVTLISPPPHHDIYSIEDLAQLIFDLKNVNPRARISVKLVSEAGVGTVAAGAVKGHADMILISGGDGGTGAAPLSSIRHAGLPWELGLSETHQCLMLNGLRSRVRLQVDGQMRTGKDAAVAAALGAEEFGFGSSLLVCMGCVMLRHCHLDSCVAGIAAQDESLRKRFRGRPGHIENYMNFVALELREIMACLGIRRVEELIGRTDILKVNEKKLTEKTKNLDFKKILYKPSAAGTPYCSARQNHKLERVLDRKLIKLSKESVDAGGNLELEMKIKNSDRAAGAMLSGWICAKKGEKGLAGSLRVKFKGAAGQSFGAFLLRGITFELRGAANDYTGKGMFGGTIIIYPDETPGTGPRNDVIIGNTAFYGATRGQAYIRGKAGERFCVRNSGITAVCEGLGDHGCEYMTGGTVVVLGRTGKNFAAGMSGGSAYVYDRENTFEDRCNKDMVETGPLGEKDRQELRRILNDHLKHTSSPLAGHILDDFRTEAERFVKVTPRGCEEAERSKTSKIEKGTLKS
jgi:glutamate synthase (NADPH) large chain